jgi:biotin synthase
MNNIIEELKQKVLAGGEINRDEAIALSETENLDELIKAADEIREKLCGSRFDMCTIINGKCGKCSEDCKFCAQSGKYETSCESYPLIDTAEIVEGAKYNADRGVLRYSIVTSGKKLTDNEVDKMCESVMEIKKNADISVCISFGLINEEQLVRLREAGVERVHCNLESSRSFFPKVCTTHTYDEKIATLKAAQRAGLSICSGGIIGLGETMEDRIDMALTIRELGVKSIPVNVLNPIAGTPLENNRVLTNDELCRVVAVYRFIVPDGSIRLAGGRGLIGDKGVKCFKSGANAAISGDMLTTAGITVETDMELLKNMGYEVRL